MKQFYLGALLRVCACLVMLCTVMFAFGQSRTITGKVTDARTGAGLSGASVMVNGTTIGAVTADDGTFSINVPQSATRLTVSSVGFATQAVTLDATNTITVSLQYGSASTMDEVVVIGYGTQNRRDVTSAVSTVKSEDFRQSGARNPLDLIQGKVAGLQIRRSGSNPNTGVGIQLRGITSLTADQTPLIVVDGIPGANLDLIQQDDIESIDVLKDGSAAAIYGTQANGGVIIITTKKGKSGPPRYEYANYFRHEKARRPDFLNPQEFRAKLASGELSPSNYTDYGNTTDFYNALINSDNLSQYHTFAASGGSAATSYRASVFFRDLQGIAIKNSRREYGGRLNINQKGLNDRLSMQLNLATNLNKANLLGGGGWEDQLTKNPTLSHYNPDGTWYFEGTSTNQLARLYQETNDRDQQTTSADVRLTLEILKGLRASFFGSMQRNSFIDNSYATLASEASVESSVAPNGGRAGKSTFLSKDYAMEPTLEYSTTLNKIHAISAVGGYSYRYHVEESFSATNYGFVNDIFEENNLGQGNQLGLGKASMGSGKGDNTLIAFFGRVNYSFQSKYMFQATIRREGSSRFGANNKWGNFPSVSAGWNINRESFMSNVSFVDNLKLRVGYGLTGNQNIANYASLVTLGGGGVYRYPDGQYRETYGPNRNPNPNLRWETKKELNIGLDFALLKNRIGGAIEVFHRKTEDLLETYTSAQPPFVREFIYTNVGAISARGIEITLNIAAVKGKNFTWNTDITASTAKNKLDRLSNEIFKLPYREYGGIGGFGALGNAIRTYEGGDLGEFWGKRYAGLDATGKWLFYNNKGESVPNARINNSFDRNVTDLAKIGNALPKLYASWSNDFTYKNLDLRIYLRGKFGHDILNTMALSYGNKVTKTNLLRTAFTKYAGINDTYMYSDYYIEPGDFVKLDEIVIGYSFNFKTPYIRNLRIYAAGQNLATFTKYTGNDPDFINDLGLGAGIDSRGPYPSTRTFLVGLNVGF